MKIMRYMVLLMLLLFLGRINAAETASQNLSEDLYWHNEALFAEGATALLGNDIELLASASMYNHHRYIRDFPRRMPATGKRVFVFDPRLHQYAAYNENGRRVKKGLASGGGNWCSDVKRPCRTPRGIFKVLKKKGYECRSSKYPLGKGGSHMPYCNYFHPAGYAIHASNDVPKNQNVSHGCIRLKPREAYWLHTKFLSIGTVVVVRNY